MNKCICVHFKVIRIWTHSVTQSDSVEDQIHEPNQAEIMCKDCGYKKYVFGRVKHVFENGKMQHVFTVCKWSSIYHTYACTDIDIEEV